MMTLAIGSRWHKIFGDLWRNKTRTVLIILSIAVGLFAVGTIVSARTILSTGMSQSFAAISPSSGTVRTEELFNEDFVHAVSGMRNVATADARRAIDVQIQAGSDEWANLRLFAIDDYEDIQVNKISPETGAWPPPENEILIERAALPLLDAEIGDVLRLQTPQEKVRELRIAGLAHDPAQLPAQIDGTPYGYISFETLDWLGEDRGFNELYIIAKNGTDTEFAQQVANEVKDKAERVGYTIPMMTAAEPGMLPLDDILEAILLLMGVLGLLSLFLSMFLIINSVSALLTQQRRQIGIMKAVGASTAQLFGMYLGMVLVYGLLALILAIPLSIVGSRGLSRFMAGMFNFDLITTEVPPEAILLQIAVGLLVPVLASIYPFIANLRVTAVEAMSTHRLGKGRFGTGIIDRLLSGTNLWFTRRRLVRPLLLSMRNIFRSKGRLVLTLITLTLGGATFIGVFSVNATLGQTMDSLLQLYQFDSVIVFSRPYRLEKIDNRAQQVDGVAQTDVYYQLPVRRVRPDGTESQTMFLIAFQIGSELVGQPAMASGRWLRPDDENAIVVDAILRKDEPDIQLGDEIILKIDGRERPFKVVGFSLGIIAPIVYANYPHVTRITGDVGQTSAVAVSIAQADADFVDETNAKLGDYLERMGFRVSTVFSMTTEREEGEAFFGIIISLLLVMALLLALVGGLGLMGTMSINVLERTREIGVLRAIGASNREVAWVFIREGIAIGLLSWGLGAMLAYPLGKGLSDAVGVSIMGVAQPFSYSTNGLLMWLALVIILSAIASLLPARNASRLTVREVLAYE